MSDKIKETLAFKDLTPEEKKARGILGRLYGPIADIVKATRNGRLYSEELWDNIFERNEIVKEMFENGGIPGELDHPADRTELCSEKIAIIMPEKPKKDENGHLIGYFDIQDTPCGRIVYQLARYGYKLGISSRGNGDVLDNDEVDPETYEFTCFDIVIVPSVKEARLTMAEGLDNNITLSQALTESLNTLTDESDKIVMSEALKNLNIKLDEKLSNDNAAKLKCNGSDTNTDKSNLTEGNESKQTQTSMDGANGVGSNEIVKSLQEALKAKSDLEATVQSLQSELAVSNTKVSELNEELSGYKTTTVKLTDKVNKSKDSEKKISSLEEELRVKEEKIKSQNEQIVSLKESTKSHTDTVSKSLNESISIKDQEIGKLNESLTNMKSEYENKINELTESFNKEKESSDSKIKELTDKVTESTRLGEGYQRLANKCVERYINMKATMLGVTKEEIRNKLPKRYTLDDIDTICESLSKYALNINKLPFSIDRKVNRVEVKSPVNESLKNPLMDDEIDDSLKRLAKID